MKKIKSVTLLKDLPGCKAPVIGEYMDGGVNAGLWEFNNGRCHAFHINFMIGYPDWFRVEYEEEEKETYHSVGIVTHHVYKDQYGNGRHVEEPQEVRTVANVGIAKEATKYLAKQLDEWLKGRCGKCGDRLIEGCKIDGACYAPIAHCKDCLKRYTRCEKCGEVS
jgi:hypothetical protein